MPVHARSRAGILEITVDGDYTLGELKRVAAEALGSSEEARVPVLLDLSGAAGLRKRSEAEYVETREFLVKHRSRIERVAVLAPGDVAYGLVRMSTVHLEAAGVPVEPFRTGAEAREWLSEQ